MGGGAGGVNTDAPTVTAVSPQPETGPGEVGGFPRGRHSAANTPIVIELEDADPGLEYVCVNLRVYQDDETYGIEQLVYRDGEFKNPFRVSSQSGTNDLTLSIKREDGWLGKFLELTIDAIDGDGNRTSEQFIYELPDAVPTETVVEVEEGDFDHVTEALARMADQFKSGDE